MGYSTKQGSLILECLKRNREQHLTVDDILEQLKEQGAAVGQTTVYRHLDKLVRQGAVLRYAGADGQSACYQYMDCCDDGHAHYHLVCAECGRMTHLECGHMDELTSHLLEHHQFSVDRFRTVIYGLCNACAAGKR